MRKTQKATEQSQFANEFDAMNAPPAKAPPAKGAPAKGAAMPMKKMPPGHKAAC